MALSPSRHLVPAGYALIALASLLFFFRTRYHPSDLLLDEAAVFLINYVFAVIYFVTFLIGHIRRHGWRNWLNIDERAYSIALVLFSISAHTLNYTTDITVFAPYVSWLAVYMLLIHAAMLAFPYRSVLSAGVQYIVYFLCGTGVFLSLYMAIFLGPLLGLSIVGAFVFGISLHSYIPIWFLVYFLFAGVRKQDLPGSQRAYWLGVSLPVLLLAIFLVRWQGVQHEIEASQAEYLLKYRDELPEWVLLSQRLPDDPLTETVMMSKARTQRSFWENMEVIGAGFRDGFEVRHDPLAVTARLLYGPLEIGEESLIPLLDAKQAARLQPPRRLWSGDDLATRQVHTHIRAYPDFRLAYVEKTLTIHHQNSHPRRWRNQQEAVYTFYLPEGSVATSLSLWIEGEEQPARLTTRAKADSAYATIVGVEQRDPALLHWQEGNRLTVTVFPCTPEEDRTFKIGFTLPLHDETGRLGLENVYFDGPQPEKAAEITLLEFDGTAPVGFSAPRNWRRIHAHRYEFEGAYTPDWRLSWEAPPLSRETFTFGGQRYAVRPLQPFREAFTPAAVVLDLNATWTKPETDAVWQQVQAYPVYAFLPQPVRLTAENREDITRQLLRYRFSLVPFHRIDDPAHTLIISKNPANSPRLSDLEAGAFAENMREFLLRADQPVKWFNLGSEAAGYVQSLRAFRAIDYAEGSTDQLADLLAQNQWPQLAEDEHTVALLTAGIAIEESAASPEAAPGKAPDHLKRLFAYNQLLRAIGRQYFDREALEESWIRQAEEAFVVSPVSSLVVLETQVDYERFGIDENKDTLGNASMSNSGSVPEPHEWALILLVALVILWQMKSYGRRTI